MAAYSPPPLPEHPPTQFITLPDGRKLAYVDYPVEKAGAEKSTVLFFHGGPGSRMLAQIFHHSASKSGIRLLSFDRAGFGRSTPHPSPKFSTHAKDAKFLLEQLNLDNIVVMGMSAGGPPAAATAALLGARVARGLVLVSAVAPAFELGGLFKAFEGTMPSNAYLFPTIASMPVYMGNFLISLLPAIRIDENTLKSLPEADQRVMTEDNMRLVNFDLAEAFVGGEQGPAMMWKTYLQDFRDFNAPEAWGMEARDIAVPTVVIHGDADMNVPLKHAEYWAKSIPKAELIVSAGEGHFGALKMGREGDLCPDLFLRISRWSGRES